MADSSAKPKNDWEIAQAAKMRPIIDIARERLGIPADQIEPYGHYKAKIGMDFVERFAGQQARRQADPRHRDQSDAGGRRQDHDHGRPRRRAQPHRQEGDDLPARAEPRALLRRQGRRGRRRLRQVVPMDEINLHFTGDFHAIGIANNLLAAMIDNHVYWGNELGIDPRRITWRRCMDMNDRALRAIVDSLGGVANGFPREDGFDITVASEMMAIFCLSTSMDDLRRRSARSSSAQTRDQQPVRRGELKADGAMTALLRDAIKPNLVQTLEGNPALVHGGPFANIAHGCNSVMATTLALKLADYVVTEAGFGADLGAEKFFDIKCRKAGLKPSAAVVVATVRALKFHGGVASPNLGSGECRGGDRGPRQPRAPSSRTSRSSACRRWSRSTASPPIPMPSCRRSSTAARPKASTAIVCTHLADGGKGAEALAKAVVGVVDSGKATYQPLYPDDMKLARQDQDDRARDLSRRRCRRAESRSATVSPNSRRTATATCRSAWRRRSTASPPIANCSARRRVSAADPRGAAVGRRRIRRGDLRRHHDHARPAARAVGRADVCQRGGPDHRPVIGSAGWCLDHF